MIRYVALLLLMFVATPAMAEVQTRNAESAKLHRLFERDWDRSMRESPVWASLLGDRRFNTEWTDLSEKARQQRQEGDIQALAALRSIDRELLPREDRVNYDLFEQSYEYALEGYQFDTHLMPISQRGGIQTENELGDQLRMQTVQDYEDWLARLSKFDDYMDQTITLMEEGIERGMVPPRVTMQRVPAQIEKQIVDAPTESLFWSPFQKMPADMGDEDKKRIRQQAKALIADTVVPAYERLHQFFTGTYLPATRSTVAASDLPNGREWYEYRVKVYTTTDMTPDEVHALGLEEVARNLDEMHAVMEEVGFEGTLQEFFAHLRSDPAFFYETSDELLEGYRAIAKQIDPQLILLFGKLPRMPYGVKPVPEAIAPDTTTAYYMRPAADGSRAGYFYANLYKPETRPKWEMPALVVHEAVPGHHLQIALQQEVEDLPDFRRYSGFTAFTEGWGLYSERLGYDLGLYEDPYARMGQITFDMWRAIRLVVDTGIHYKGWSRQQAIDYFLEHSPRPELDVINEIDRYISMPGQALAYKLGQLKLLEMRELAREELGDGFDIRDFHDEVLSYGSVPLSVLERGVKDWISSVKDDSAAD